MHRIKHEVVLWAVGICAIAFILTAVSFSGLPGPVPDTPVEDAQVAEVVLTIDDLYVQKPVKIVQGETVLRLLERLAASEGALQLQTKEYAGLGVLVQGMGGKINGADNKYWQYTVNGVMPQVGADKLELKSGDSIEWKFAISEF